MSDNWTIIIPEDPAIVPDANRQARARNWFERAAPHAERIEIKTTATIGFFDCGGNFEGIKCPSCSGEIEMEWWCQRMDEDSVDGFKLLKYATPCCGASHTLHELVYEWPQGFGRFALEIKNADIGKLNEKQVRELETILGYKVRVIYRHI